MGDQHWTAMGKPRPWPELDHPAGAFERALRRGMAEMRSRELDELTRMPDDLAGFTGIVGPDGIDPIERDWVFADLDGEPLHVERDS